MKREKTVEQKLVISVCNFLLPEISEVLNNGDYPDVEIRGFSANCKSNYINTDKITDLISKENNTNFDYIFIGSVCHAFKKPQIKGQKIKRVKLELCFELFLNREIVSYYIAQGYYLVTNGWLRNFKTHVKNWGFDENTATQFFQESTKGIILLDTQIPGDYLPNLKALSEYMGVPYKIIPIGLSHCKQFIDSMVLKWRCKTNRKLLNDKIASASKLSADYSVILTQLNILVNLTDEPKIVQVGFELLNLLFAPAGLNFISYNDNEEKRYQSGKATNNNNNSFKIEVVYSKELLGIFEINNIQFPQYISQYKEMGKLISQIFGLAIANARKYKITIEQKNQLELYSQDLQKINLSKDKFFSIIAHDLKSPFNSLIRISEYLVEAINDNELKSIETGVQIINQVSNNTYRLLINLLEWAQTQTGKISYNPERIVLFSILKETIDMQKVHATTKNIIISNQIHSEISIVGDKNMLKTVVRNLISNAIKYTPTNGKVSISANVKDKDIQVSVADNGVGITKKCIESLFILENTISALGTNKETGTGLGLILSKEYIDQHNGRIWVESEEGKGSIFHFSLPIRTPINAN